MISKFLIMRTSLDSYVMISIQALVGISVMLLFTFTLYQPLLRKFGDIRVLIFVELFACITSAMRATPSPIPKAQYAIAAIFNQFGNALVDAPFITFASMQTTPKSRGKVMGIFMSANSITRAGLSAVAGALVDWHARDAQIVFMFFTFASVLLLCFVRAPQVM